MPTPPTAIARLLCCIFALGIGPYGVHAKVKLVAAPSKLPSARVTAITTKAVGAVNTTAYSVYFYESGKLISPWHEITLHAGDALFHFVCEIPKETRAKWEVMTRLVGNPIKQDVKNGKLRFHPYNIHWNYGMLPQTWEDPLEINSELEEGGDNDPLDVIEIGAKTCKSGGVYKVKVLGVLALVDVGEVDWKVITISIDDPKAALVNDVPDVNKHFPGELEKIMVWMRDYKIPDGKPPNQFGYNGTTQSRDFALGVIEETHEAYVLLKSGVNANIDKLSLI